MLSQIGNHDFVPVEGEAFADPAVAAAADGDALSINGDSLDLRLGRAIGARAT